MPCANTSCQNIQFMEIGELVVRIFITVQNVEVVTRQFGWLRVGGRELQ